MSHLRIHEVRKSHFLRHLCIKTIILPRQARDKHRENSTKRVAVWASQVGYREAIGRFFSAHVAEGTDTGTDRVVAPTHAAKL